MYISVEMLTVLTEKQTFTSGEPGWLLDPFVGSVNDPNTVYTH